MQIGRYREEKAEVRLFFPFARISRDCTKTIFVPIQSLTTSAQSTVTVYLLKYQLSAWGVCGASRKVSSVHDRIVPYWSVRSPANQTLSCQERVLDPFRTYAFFVLEMQLFFRFQKKIATTRSVFESFLTVHTNTLYRCENASKPVLAVDEGVV